jgi:hypothetical protein
MWSAYGNGYSLGKEFMSTAALILPGFHPAPVNQIRKSGLRVGVIVAGLEKRSGLIEM